MSCLTATNRTTAKMVNLLGQGEQADVLELEKLLSSMAGQITIMATMANREEGEKREDIKKALTTLCKEVDEMFKDIADIFIKGQLATEVKLNFKQTDILIIHNV